MLDDVTGPRRKGWIRPLGGFAAWLGGWRGREVMGFGHVRDTNTLGFCGGDGVCIGRAVPYYAFLEFACWAIFLPIYR